MRHGIRLEEQGDPTDPRHGLLEQPQQLPTSSVVTLDNPVTLLPGRARLVTSLSATGFPTAPKTMGSIVVARLAASAPSEPPADMMTSTLSATSSAARTG